MKKTNKTKACVSCGEEKTLDQFTFYSSAYTYSKRCLDCKIEPKKLEIFKDGKLNTKQEKGFNWLLGYTTKYY